MDIAEILVNLCSIAGPSGFEKPVAECVKELLKPYMDEVWFDVMGNTIGVRRCGKENAKKLLLDAHIDEIGLIVTGVQEGFLRFASLGALDARVLPASGVEILTDPVKYGVISVLPPHVLSKEDTNKVLKIEDLLIDVGLSHEDAVASIPLGTPGVVSGRVQRFGDNYICGKALDDRAGFVSILRAVELLKSVQLDVDLYVMASVQEEVGVRGAAPGVFAIAPDWAVIVDVDFAKSPDTKPSETNEEIGKGVIISKGPNVNLALTQSAIELAKSLSLQHQVNVVPGGNSGTNARVIQVSREGVATALFGIPLRYMHTSWEVAALDDIENAAILISELAKTL